jgi:epsilon-lactone hydrolase
MHPGPKPNMTTKNPVGVLIFRAKNLPMPAAAGLFTPWTDLTGSGDSYRSNDGRDCVIAWKNQLDKAARCYVGGADPADPLASPIYAAYTDRFPPTMITTGTRDLFLSDGTRLYWSLRDAGVPVSLRVWEGMWHAFNVEPDIPEGRHAREEVAAFLTGQLEKRH